MGNVSNLFSLIEQNSKVYIINQFSYDKKKRKHLVEKYNTNSTFEASSKEIVYSNLILKSESLLSHIEGYNLEDLWSNLIDDVNVLSIKSFIDSAIRHYNIESIEELNVFLLSFNEDFIYYRILDKDKVYLNSKTIVEKIIKSLALKEEEKALSEFFLRDISIDARIDWSKYNKQISELIAYFAGSEKYSKSFLESIRVTLNLKEDEEILSHFKSIGVFGINFEPLYAALKLSQEYSYVDADVDKLDSEDIPDSAKVLNAFTIDDETTYDFDDALSIDKEGGIYVVSVHISNFSNLFSIDSTYSDNARKLVNTIYAPNGNFNLYSKKLVDKISLISGSVRSVLTVKFYVDNSSVINYKVERNYIKISDNYTYDQFETLISKNPDYQFLNDFTKHLYEERLKGADFKFFNQEVAIRVNKDNKLSINCMELLDSRRIISELMILTNFYVSKYFNQNSLPGIFRSQRKSYDLETSMIDAEPPFSFHIKVSPVDVSSACDPHYGLGLESYLQITSPIRRFLDAVNMWQVSYFLKERKVLFDSNYIDRILATTTPQLASSREKSKKVYKLWILKYLNQSKDKNLSGYIYSTLRDKYIVFFNELNFFESISKENCTNLYQKDDFVNLSFDYIDFAKLEIINLKD
jgi:exoribonuclease R